MTKLLTTISLLAVLMVSIASCGGNSAPLDMSSGTQTGTQTGTDKSAPAADTQASSGGLPSLPREISGEPNSGGDDTIVVPGSAAILSQGAVADGTTLILTSTEGELAYALYKVEGLAGKKVSGFTIEILPGSLDQQYSVGVSNFSDGVWDFLTTGSLPEFEYDFSEDMTRRTSELGNFYFLVVTSGGDSATVQQTTVFSHTRGEGEIDEPNCGGDISVSHGLPASIVVEWAEIPGATSYEIFRRQWIKGDDWTPGMGFEGSDWVSVGTTGDLRFEDTTVELSTLYQYKVRGVNDAGEGGCTRAESGYAGDPPAGFGGDNGGGTGGDETGDDNGGGTGGDDTGDDTGDDNGSGDETGDDNGGGTGGDDTGDDNGGGTGGDDTGDDNGGDTGGDTGGDGAGDDNGGDTGGDTGGDGAGDDNGGDTGGGDSGGDGAGDDGGQI